MNTRCRIVSCRLRGSERIEPVTAQTIECATTYLKLVGPATVFAFWRAIDDLPTPVKLKLTTGEQCLLQFLATTLDAGLRTGEGYSKTFGELLLGEAFKLGERQCLAVGGRQFLNHTAKGFTQLASVFQFRFVRFAREFR